MTSGTAGGTAITHLDVSVREALLVQVGQPVHQVAKIARAGWWVVVVGGGGGWWWWVVVVGGRVAGNSLP